MTTLKANTSAKTTSPQKARELALQYTLDDLPSSQHRAGLAGLALVVQWINKRRITKDGLLEITRIDSQHLTLRIDEKGLGSLLDEVYAAAQGEIETEKPYKTKQGELKEPLRVEQRETIDSKGKQKTKIIYVYPVTIPRGSFQSSWDPTTTDGISGLWVKLWRDTIWSIFRGIPATRQPYEARAGGQPVNDAATMWKTLLVPGKPVELPSTYYLSAQAKTAENVSFRDRAKNLLLLHFWPFAAAMYVPATVDNDGKRKFIGYALAVPDVVDLETYVDVFPDALQSRGVEATAYRPREAVVDLAIEGGADLMRLLRQRLRQREGERRTADLVNAVDVFHAAKQGNSINVLSFARIEPKESMLDEYENRKGVYWSGLFRRQRLLNLFRQDPWWQHFGKLCATNPFDRTFGDRSFRHDARVALTEMEMQMQAETDDNTQPNKTVEELVYRAVRTYLGKRLAAKYDLTWSEAQQHDEAKREYQAKREKLAREAFLAVRSRTGADFIEYFTSTLCSVPQHLSEAGYLKMSEALLEQTERMRSLTLLALSACA